MENFWMYQFESHEEEVCAPWAAPGCAAKLQSSAPGPGRLSLCLSLDKQGMGGEREVSLEAMVA